MIKNKKNNISEAVRENTSDFDNFTDFKRGAMNGPFIYNQVNASSIDNIRANGVVGSNEFLDTMAFGRGLYTVLTYDDCKSYNHWNSGAMIKYAAKRGACNNFIVLDPGMRRIMEKNGLLTVHEDLQSNIKRLFGAENFRNISNYGISERWDSMLRSIENAVHIDRFNTVKDYKRSSKSDNLERILDVYDVDGVAGITGYGQMLVFRSLDLLTPYKICYKGKTNPYSNGKMNSGGWYDKESDAYWDYALQDENMFNNVNFTVDAYRRATKDYPQTPFQSKSNCGFALIQKNKDEYNYLSVRDHKYFSPLNFDYATAWNPMTNQASFNVSVNGKDREFIVSTDDFGKTVKFIKPRMKDKEGNPYELTYDKFVSIMNKEKARREGGNGSLNEAVSEVFTHKTKDEFKKSLKSDKTVYVYTCTDRKRALSSILKTGMSPEFLGTNPRDPSIWYGIGAYCSYDLRGCLGNLGTYGDCIVKFALKDGFKDFVIFDPDMRRKYDPGKTVAQEIRSLVPDDVWNKLKHLEGRFSHDEYGGGPAKAFYELLKGSAAGKINLATYFDENMLAKTRIRGYIFNGRNNAYTIVVRDFNSLIPVGYGIPKFDTSSRYTNRSLDDIEWHDSDELDNAFDDLNKNVYPFFQYRGEYDKVGVFDRPSCGFSLVKGSNGYNYKDIYFHRPLLPIDAEYAVDFNPNTKMASFVCLGGKEFNIQVDDDLNVVVTAFNKKTGEQARVNYEKFMAIVEKYMQAGKISSNTKIYPNCLWNPNTDRKK